MKTLALTLLLLLLVPLTAAPVVADADPEPPPDVKGELKRLSGTFQVTRFEADGVKSSEATLKTMLVIQKGADWEFRSGGDSTTGTDTVNPARSPREIDATYTNGHLRGRTAKGIYKIEGDTVTYCWAEPGLERPRQFAGDKRGHTLFVLKRVKK